MALEEKINLQEKQGGFTFTWSIHNFGHCPHKEGEWFNSPVFMVDSLGDASWSLRMYPKGNNCPDFVSCFLSKCKECPSCVYAFFVYSNAEAKFKNIFEEACHTSKPGIGHGCQKFLSLKDIHSYLDDDTLTVQCRMWNKDDGDCPSTVHCHAHTEIKVTKIDYTWVLDDIVTPGELSFRYKFGHTAQVPARMSDLPLLKIHVLNGGSSGEDAVHFGVEILELRKAFFVVCVVRSLDAEGRVIHSARSERWVDFPNAQDGWGFPILPKQKLYSNESHYMLSNKLVLKCEFSFSGDDVVERVEYGSAADPKTVHNLTPSGQETWNENLQKFYTEGKLSNVAICTTDRRFPAHREFLSAQSEVFCAMFEHNMKEQSSGEINIEDLEDETVDTMLKFIYTGAVGDLDNAQAQKLYYAADKYGIKSLFRICAQYLMNNVSLSNVCDVLTLADAHSDDKLKSCAKEVILANAQEFLNLEDWKKIKKNNSQLTIETMEWLLCNKLNLKEECDSRCLLTTDHGRNFSVGIGMGKPKEPFA